MYLKSYAPFALLLVLTASARGGYIPMETVKSAAQKSEIIVVGQVTKVETIGREMSAQWKIAIVHQRATVKVFRALHSADASPLALDEITIDFPTCDPAVPTILTGRPWFPSLVPNGITYAIPLRRGIAQDAPVPAPSYEFVAEDGFGLFFPAAKEPLNAKPAASAEDFLNRELANTFVHGDFRIFDSTYSFLRTASWTNPEIVAPIVALLQQENLADARWVDIAAATYCEQGTPRSALAQLRADKKPQFTSTLILQLAFAKAKPDKLEERLLLSIVAHQGQMQSTGIRSVLAEDYLTDPLFIELETAALANGDSATLDIANGLIKDAKSPLAAPAVAAARKVITLPIGENHPNLGPAESLILRVGTDDDFAFLLQQINRAPKDDPAAFPLFIVQAGDGTPARTLEICRRYIDVDTSVPNGWWRESKDFRLSDQAGQMIQTLSQQNFGFNPGDPIASRDQALTRIRAWLKTNPKF